MSTKTFTGTVSTTLPAKPAQLDYIRGLFAERDLATLAPEKADAIRLVLAGTITIPRSSASACIDDLKALPRLAVAGDTSSTPVADVPEGRYAIEVDGVIKFYKVDRPTEGKWAGYTFVKVQASDDLYPVRGKAAQSAVLAAIVEAGVEAASKRYGHELGSCGVCGRTLTDETSRANGIGPICAAAKGW